MPFAHLKLPGLDAARILAAVEPVLAAHRVEGVELIWRTGSQGWVLEVNVEVPGARTPGAGVTVDLCADLSRDLSAALDVADVIPRAYSLEVGSPGVERALYTADDYRRFAGQEARLKLRLAVAGQRVLRGTLQGLDDAGRVRLAGERGEHALELADIESARLVFSFGQGASRPGKVDRAGGPQGRARPSRGRVAERRGSQGES